MPTIDDRSEAFEILNASAVGAGDSYQINVPVDTVRTFQSVVTGTVTFAVEVSNDGVNWVELFQDSISDGWESPAAWKYVRGNYLSGTGTVVLTLGV